MSDTSPRDVIRRTVNDGRIVLEDVPEISPNVGEMLRRFHNIRGALLQDFSADGNSVYITTRFADTAQIHRIDQPEGARRQLTFFKEPAQDAQRRPGAENDLLTSKNEVINARVEIASIQAQYRDEIAKAESEKYTALSNMYDAEAVVTKLQNQYMNYSVRSGMYYITAPQNGYITGIKLHVLEGDSIPRIYPNAFRFYSESGLGTVMCGEPRIRHFDHVSGTRRNLNVTGIIVDGNQGATQAGGGHFSSVDVVDGFFGGVVASVFINYNITPGKNITCGLMVFCLIRLDDCTTVVDFHIACRLGNSQLFIGWLNAVHPSNK